MDNNLPVQGTNGEKSKENTKPKGKRDFIFQDIKGNEIELEFEYGTTIDQVLKIYMKNLLNQSHYYMIEKYSSFTMQ